MQLYSQYDARNVLPALGGWIEQSPSFLALIQTVDTERGRWERVREEHAKKQARRESSRA